MKTIIGLAGKARTGKDTVAEYLRDHHGFSIVRFADPLRFMLEEGLHIPKVYVETRKGEPIPGIGKSYRELAQTLGTEWGRNMIDPDLWLNFADAVCGALDNSLIVISDVRFDNEAAWIRKVGRLWHVRRNNVEPVRRHISEAGIDPLPGEPIIENNEGLDCLYWQINHLMEPECAKPLNPVPTRKRTIYLNVFDEGERVFGSFYVDRADAGLTKEGKRVVVDIEL